MNVIQCPPANPCEHCGRVIVPDQKHACKKKSSPELGWPTRSHRVTHVSQDEFGGWGPMVRVMEDNVQ